MLRTKTLALALALLGASLASAQFDFGGGETDKPWEDFKLNPKTRLKLEFRNAGIDAILSLFQKQSGVTIVKDPALTDRLSLSSAKPVSLADAFQILSTTLSLKGYDLKKEGKLLVIRKRDQGGGAGRGQFDPSMLAGMMGGQKDNELKVYPIKLANASQVARVVNEVFATQGQGGFPGGFQFPGQGGGGGGRFGGGQGQGQGGNRFGGGQGINFGRGNQQPQVRASSDDFSNSVIVNAPRQQQEEVARIIREIDKQTEQPLQSKVYKLTYASATLLQPTVQNVLNSQTPRGRGGANSQTQQNPFFQIRAAFGGSAAGSGQVAADDRTNTLVVSATEENQAIVSQVIKELDKEVPLQNGTFVFPLQNARADDIATLLNQAFGQRQGVNGRGVGGFGQTNRNTGNNQNRNNNLGGGNQNRLGGDNNGVQDQALPIALKDPNAESGELETTVAVAQAFGGGFFGQNRGGQQQQQPPRDASGRVVNVNDLTNQVTTISDPNTNSVIVVTTPENAELLRKILDQLDRIPEQVMIETLIVEASLDKSTKLGVEFNFTTGQLFNQKGVTAGGTTSFPDTTSTAGQGLKVSSAGANVNAIVSALQTDDRFNILSTPRIFTSNNVQAEINISQRVPFVVNQRADANGNILFTYDFLDVGIVLTVTPRITSNGYVTMDVSQTANDLQGFTTFNAPIVNQRQADTTVSVKDGETIILGGIIRNSVTSTVRKVPLLGDIPILGNLFRSTTKGNQKTELLVFLTPRIVRDPDDARLLRDRNIRGLSPGVQDSVKKTINPGGGNPAPPATLPTDPKKPPVKNGGGQP